MVSTTTAQVMQRLNLSRSLAPLMALAGSLMALYPVVLTAGLQLREGGETTMLTSAGLVLCLIAGAGLLYSGDRLHRADAQRRNG